MTKRLVLLAWCLCGSMAGQAQELFINTKPASNMAANSMGFRLNNSVYGTDAGLKTLLSQEIMYGFSARFMLHAFVFEDNQFTQGYVYRGANLYAKYRFLAHDAIHEHFRMAAFGRISMAPNPDQNHEATIEGAYSGANIGMVATKLMHKLALSATTGYTYLFPSGDGFLKNGQALEYTLSAGYLALPKTYTSYGQTNVNLMLELLGKTQWATANEGGNAEEQESHYLDAAPGIQFIVQSRARIDLSWRSQMFGNMVRPWHNEAFIRLEYNIFGVARDSRKS